MSLRLKSVVTLMVVFALALGSDLFAQPIFENRTPVGFSPSDSTTKISFPSGEDINILVDLNEAANETYPVIGNFQKVEKAQPYFTAEPNKQAYMDQAVAIDDDGAIHRAWVMQRGITDFTNAASTPVYGVVYAKSLDGGRTFSDTVSVSGTLRFDMITPNLSVTSGFSTLDIVLNSKGNPRVAYGMGHSPDGIYTQNDNRRSGTRKAYNNIYFNYSNDGGSSWLPANNAVVINDTASVLGRKNAFPRMAVTSTDDVFIVYERNMQDIAAIASAMNNDIIVAKVDNDSLQLGSAQAVSIGSMGQGTSRGGVRIDNNSDIGLSPDIAVGDDDVLHVIWYNSNDDAIQHKSVPASLWDQVGGNGWSQGDGATVGTFADRMANGNGFGMSNALVSVAGSSDRSMYAGDHLDGRGVHLFPTVVIDRQRTPDRVFALWKHTDAATGTFSDENIAYNFYNYDGLKGAAASWPTSLVAFPQSSGANGQAVNSGALFANGTMHQVEQHWAFVDRVTAVVDDRLSSRGDLHIVFSGGLSTKLNTPATAALAPATALGAGNSLYYSRFNGVEWELPTVVATANNVTVSGQTDDGVASKYRDLFAPRIDMRSGDENIYLTFVGGSPMVVSQDIRTGNAAANSGRGYSALSMGDIHPMPYFKVLGRVTTYDDVSRPVGGNQYLLTYKPVHPQTSSSKNMIPILAADNSNGSGIGATQPGSSNAPGGFLTGRWTRVAATSLGVTSLTPATAGAVYKGASNQVQTQNDNGKWQGLSDDDGNNAYGEWGDDGDKIGLLVKLNVLASDSATNLMVIRASSAAQATQAGYSSSNRTSQSISLGGAGSAQATFVSGTVVGAAGSADAVLAATNYPLGSYFILGANISIAATNSPPVVRIVSPDANTLGSGAFGNETQDIRYVLYDADDNIISNTAGLQMRLYFYTDSGLKNVQDIQTFATLIVDQRDITAINTSGTNDFIEGASAANIQTYTWDDPGTVLQRLGFAPLTKVPDGTYFIYVVADDLINPAVFAVSDGALKIRHIPLIKSVQPVAADTVDTGEFNLARKTNPYNMKFQIVDYDDNAQVRLFYSANSALSLANVVITGDYPNQTLSLTGASAMELSDTLRTDEDVDFNFDVTAQGSGQDSLIAQNNYFLYAVVADEDTFALRVSSQPLAVRHGPSFEFTAPLKGQVLPINTSQQFKYTIEWQRGRSDRDLDGNATIALYYTGVDPNTQDFSGTSSANLLATTGTNAGNAVLIQDGIREDDEGAADQFVWDFRNPPGALPKTYRSRPRASTTNANNANVYQVGATVDTAWVYAVMADTLGNTRVQMGGAVLLQGSGASPASQLPRVVMKTPPQTGQTLINGDVIRLEWDAFLIDDGTGTDDAYLRLYAAPKNKYTTITQLETHAGAGNGDVFLINSLDGTNINAAGAQIEDYTGATSLKIQRIMESDENFYLWDTKTTSFKIQGTPTEFDIFVAASMDPQFGDDVFVNGTVDSIATGNGSQSMNAVLSKAPGSLRVEGADPIYSIELGPTALAASSGDTLDFQVLANSQASSIDLMAFHLNVPRSRFEVIDQDAGTAGVQPFRDSTGAFIGAATIAQNDTSQGTDQWIYLNFVESKIGSQVIGNVAGDSSQVAATVQLLVKRFTGGAPADTVLAWNTGGSRKTGFRNGTTELAAPPRDIVVTLTPRARLLATVPLQGRTSYSDTLDVHLREIGSTQDITDESYIRANDVALDSTGGGGSEATSTIGLININDGAVPPGPGVFVVGETVTGSIGGGTAVVTAFDDPTLTVGEPTAGTAPVIGELFTGGTSGAVGEISTFTQTPAVAAAPVVLSDSVNVVSDGFGTFTLTEIPPGIYEVTVKADGYIAGRSDTMNLFNGTSVTADPTFGSDNLGNLSPATPFGYLKGGDATGDNQIDVSDATLVFNLWNLTPADSGFEGVADINDDGIINAIDLGFVSQNFGIDGFGAPPVFKRGYATGDNENAVVELKGLENVDSWWAGREFEVNLNVTGMTDVMAYGLSVSFEPNRVKLVGGNKGVTEGDIFAKNPHGSLFFHRIQPGQIDLTAGRIGEAWSASGNANMATLRFVALGDEPGKLEIIGGDLVNSEFRGSPMQVEKAPALPKVAALHQNFPNPFNPSTEIRFDIPSEGLVKLRIYNQLGQTVRTLADKRMKAGTYRVKWDGTTEAGHDVSSGVYFYNLEAGDFGKIRKMTLVK